MVINIIEVGASGAEPFIIDTEGFSHYNPIEREYFGYLEEALDSIEEGEVEVVIPYGVSLSSGEFPDDFKMRAEVNLPAEIDKVVMVHLT